MKGVEGTGLGNRIRFIRKEHRLTITQLSALTDISCGNLSEIERNFYIPSHDKLTKLAKALDCSVLWLLTGKQKLSEKQQIIFELYDQLDNSEQEELFVFIEYRYHKNH